MDLVWHHSKNAHIRTHADRVLWSILCGVLVRHDCCCCCCCNLTNGPRVWFQLNENANICNKFYRDMFVSIAFTPGVAPLRLYDICVLCLLNCIWLCLHSTKTYRFDFSVWNFSAAFQKKKKKMTMNVMCANDLNSCKTYAYACTGAIND